MSTVQNGDTVKVHYTGKLTSGEEFDSSRDREPLSFTVGGNQVIKGFEDGVLGMETGDEKSITIPADEAYGPYHDTLVASVARSDIPGSENMVIGQQVEVKRDDDSVFRMTVTEMTDDRVTLDANHPLAGKDLVFDIQLVEIVNS